MSACYVQRRYYCAHCNCMVDEFSCVVLGCTVEECLPHSEQLYGCIFACQVTKSKVKEVSFHTFLFDLFYLACLLSLREFFTLLTAARLCSCLKSRAIYVKNFSECLLSWIRNGFACWKSSREVKVVYFPQEGDHVRYDCRNVYVTAISCLL